MPSNGSSSPPDACIIFVSALVLDMTKASDLLLKVPALVPESFWVFLLSSVIRNDFLRPPSSLYQGGKGTHQQRISYWWWLCCNQWELLRSLKRPGGMVQV